MKIISLISYLVILATNVLGDNEWTQGQLPFQVSGASQASTNQHIGTKGPASPATYTQEGYPEGGIESLQNPVYEPSSDVSAYQQIPQVYDNSVYEQAGQTQDQVFQQDGQVYQQNGQVYQQDGQVYQQDGQAYQQDGQAYQQDGQVYQQNGQVYQQGGQAYQQDGPIYQQEGQVYQQNNQVYQQPQPIQPQAYTDTQARITNGPQPIYSEQVNSHQEQQINTQAPQAPQYIQKNQKSLQYYNGQVQQAIPSSIKSRSDLVAPESKFSSIMSSIREFVRSFFSFKEGTARKDSGMTAILSLSSLIIGSILYL